MEVEEYQKPQNPQEKRQMREDSPMHNDNFFVERLIEDEEITLTRKKLKGTRLSFTQGNMETHEFKRKQPTFTSSLDISIQYDGSSSAVTLASSKISVPILLQQFYFNFADCRKHFSSKSLLENSLQLQLFKFSRWVNISDQIITENPDLISEGDLIKLQPL
jgi:hypothetical protein